MKSLIALMLLAATPALAAEFQVLSAGAVEPGLHAAIEAFRKESGHAPKVRFATAPMLRRLVINDGALEDVVIAPPAVLDEFLTAGRIQPAGRTALGKVGAGIAVRTGAPVPEVGNADALKQAVLAADTLVFNQASTGIYLEGLFTRMGVWDAVKAKTTRYPDGAAVMEHVLRGQGREIGFGAITEILLYRDKGLRLVAPLPADVQNYTSYAAALAVQPRNPAPAAAFLTFLGTPAAKALFAAAGIE